MLTMPNCGVNTTNIVGIDPGSNTLGVSVLEINIETLSIVSTIAWTIVGNNLINKDSWVSTIHSERTDRILALEEKLFAIFNYYNPVLVVCESPYISHKFPQAGLVLTEVMSGIRRAVMRYDIWKELYTIDPPTVKRSVGAPGNAQKDVMREKVIALNHILNYNGNIPITALDEHSIDAISVAYGHYRKLLG